MAVELFKTPLYNDASLRLYYRMEDVNDSKGIANLTNSNSVTFTAAQFNNGANFGTANTNKALIYTASNPLTANEINTMTYNFWVKLTTEIGAGEYRFLEFNTGFPGAGFMGNVLKYEYNSGTRRLAGFTALSTTSASVLYTITMGTTLFFMLTLRKNTETALDLFVNGILVDSDTGVGDNTSNGAGTNYIAIATDRSSSSNFANAIIDDFAVFERALTDAEINNLYTGNFGGTQPAFEI